MNFNQKIKSIISFLTQVFTEFSNDKALKFGAALSYYTIFSLAPLLIIVIAIAGFFLGRDAMQGEIYYQINSFVGNEAAVQLQQMIKNVHLSGNTLLAGIVSTFVLILGATGIFGEIQDSINQIWGLKSKPKRGLLKIIINRLISFSLIVSLGFVLIVSLTLNALITALSHRLVKLFPAIGVYFVNMLDNVLTFIITTVIFAVIFKVLPDARIKWKDVGVGAIVTTLLFMIGKFAISFYIGQSNFTNAYGAAGSLIVIMVWVYYSAIILYFGAEFTKIYALKYGSRIYPNDYAVWIKVEEKELEKQPKK